MEPQSWTRAHLLWRGVIYGALAWLVYAAVEFLAFTPLGLLTQPNSTISPWHWKASVMLGLTYAATGAIAGAIIALLISLAAGGRLSGDEAERTLETGATITLILAAVGHMVAGRMFATQELISIATGCALLAVLVLSLFSEDWMERLPGLRNPWIATLLLIPAPFVYEAVIRNRSGRAKAAFSLVSVVVLVGALLLAGRRRSLGARVPVWRSAAITGLVLAGAVAAVVSNRHMAPVGDTGANASSSAQGKPNVVLIVLDTVRADHLPFYGYERNTAPNLSKFAQESTLYRHPLATSPMTLPGHASLFTGLYASWHGAHYDQPEHPGGRPLSDKFQTLAEALDSQGYSTLGVASNTAYLQPTFGLNQGFRFYDWRVALPVLGNTKKYMLRHRLRRLLEPFVSTADFDKVVREADEITSDAIGALEQTAKRTQPFFLFLNYMDAHTPYTPPHPYDSLFPGKMRGFLLPDYLKLQEGMLTGERQITEPERQHLISQYDGGIAFLDAELGRLFEHLKKSGAYERSIIIVTSDHGEAFGEQGMIEHGGGSVHQDQVFVPLLIKYPGERKPSVYEAPVSQVDILPTVLDALQSPIAQNIQGRSLRQPPLADRMLITESFKPLKWGKYTERAAVIGFRKLIVSTAAAPEVYDVAVDAREQRNLYVKGDADATVLQVRLAEWTKAVPRRSGSGTKLDDAALQRLKSLGYVQ